MKLQISFNSIDLKQALDSAQKVKDYADIFEIGTLLLFSSGVQAIKEFKEAFPEKTIFVDSKVVDDGKEIVNYFSDISCEWLSVMAGTNKRIIHSACSAAHEKNKKIMLDLLDTHSLGQSAFEAKNLGADGLIFHQPITDDPHQLLDMWEMVKGNTDLPIYIATNTIAKDIGEIIDLKPSGIIVGKEITHADNPVEQAKHYHTLCHPTSY